MLLTEQQRVELERREWEPEPCYAITLYRKHFPAPDGGVYHGALQVDKQTGEIANLSGPPEAIGELVAILGIQPPGFRLVPEEVAERGLRHIASVRREAQNYLDVCEVRADEPDQSDETKETWARIVEEARQSLAEIDALASALQGGREAVSMREALAGLVQEWRRAAEPRPGGASVLSEERRAGAAEAYRECARQLSMVLASHPTETLDAGVVGVPVGEIESWLTQLSEALLGRRYGDSESVPLTNEQRLRRVKEVHAALFRLHHRLQQNGG